MILKLITLDVTGTILQLRETVGHQYAKVASRHHVNASSDLLTKNFFLVFKEMRLEHPNFGANNSIGWQEWWRQLVVRVFQNSLQTNTIESTTLNNISSDLIEVYATKECWRLADGAESLLDRLRNKNIRLGVISNYDPRLESILKDLNVRNYFNFVLDSYTVKCEKPNSGIFKIVEDMNVDVEKSEILHIGDNPKLDFLGARNVGWNAILIAKNPIEVSLNFPHTEKEWVVGNISDVYQILEEKQLL